VVLIHLENLKFSAFQALKGEEFEQCQRQIPEMEIDQVLCVRLAAYIATDGYRRLCAADRKSWIDLLHPPNE
tara:strand:- start:1069 stop:1284 length:216 start_codon:yes stop_codon:yes gene_type:complete